MARFRSIADSAGVRDALRYLNAQGGHRFTAVFAFQGDTLRNVAFVDRADPGVEQCEDQPVLESYCVFVRRSGDTFRTDDSAQDPRVDGHPKQRTVRSYCGVPLLAEDGSLYGTVCHFDFDAVPYAQDEVHLLEDVAPFLVAALSRGTGVPGFVAA